MAEAAAAEAPAASFDYSTLIDKGSTPASPLPVATEPVVEPVADETPSPETAAANDTPVVKEEKAEPKADEKTEGTPDKHRQKIDQRIAALEKMHDKLNEKIAAGEATPKDVAKFEQKKDELHAILEADKEDPTTDRSVIAKRVLDNETKTQSEIETLRAELRQEKADRIWDKQEREHPGVNVREVWQNSIEAAQEAVKEELEAGELSDLTKTQVERLAYAKAKKIYASRVDVAAKSVAAKSAKAAPVPAPVVKPKPAPEPPSKTTPQGGKVTVSGSSSAAPKPAELDYNARAPALYRGLIAKD